MRPRLLGLSLTTALAVLLPLLAAEGASAAVTATPGTTRISAAALEALCAPGDTASARSTPTAWREHPDHPDVSHADQKALDPVASPHQLRRAERALPSRVRIPVHVSIVRGSHRTDRTVPMRASRAYVERLNKSFAGEKSSLGPGTRYRFWLASVRVVKNDTWYHAVGNSKADRTMRRKLHRGGAHSLNLYLTRPGSPGDFSGILGYARFPWQYKSPNRGLDGVTVSVDGLPGGRAAGYRSGDTLVHEVGHWMGLFHTFQGGCEGRGDHVADTPAEAEPSFRCQVGRNTCRAPGVDPVRNFMNYSYDSCMNHFTQGQVDRMDLAWFRYRDKDR